ncbi:serine/threonine protein kinase [Stigmatella aurantiaca]|uniref:non-specific serine/threonine protein kinase n=1 Tax=Stigmatella aurantiaca (strain DW4/3-1) TaxID=378806 RepID=Q08S29_STIAD|nr:serine/threonine-protein kinase [Stigmatella aurantiaca]ADO73133.1 Protein kinase [Stigmatella aurantiaca DW4/3-1]EAU63283.1 protein kinase [Stigmatella aurantiaca DW4/3-1]
MDPLSLPAGSLVGSWRVLRLHGSGSYGAVYQVERSGPGVSGPFALKLARYPRDPRFEREGELLSRLHHPSVPRLHARGEWLHPSGSPFPFLVMDWVDGVPLYTWASQHPLSSHQGLRLLAQVARALEATHAAQGIHRDVKGENILVRASDSRAVLVDFGSCNHHGARALTFQCPPPGTPQYYSPESLLFQWEWRHQREARYEATPADDLYALGVTAYRLVTGRYPPDALDMEMTEDGFRPFYPDWIPPETWGPVSPGLSDIIQRLLSRTPSARGTAGEIASLLEEAAKKTASGTGRSLAPDAAQVLPPKTASSAPPLKSLAGSLGLAFAASLILSVGATWLGAAFSEEESSGVLLQGGADGGTAGLADASVSASQPHAASQPGADFIGLGIPKKPFAGQRKPPCEPRFETEIHGGCWAPHREAPPCGRNSFEWQGSCYTPVIDLSRPSTSGDP